MESYNNYCALKVRVKCGKKENEDSMCGCYYKDCKLLFKNYDDLDRYKDDEQYLIATIANNGLISEDMIRAVIPVRTVDVLEDQWKAAMNHHRPNGLTWEKATDEQRMQFIAKYLNHHPLRTQITDAVYPCYQ